MIIEGGGVLLIDCYDVSDNFSAYTAGVECKAEISAPLNATRPLGMHLLRIFYFLLFVHNGKKIL